MTEILTPIGLILDALGAAILLGPEYSQLRNFWRKFDITRYSFSKLKIELENGSTEAGKIRYMPIRKFINQRIEDRITENHLFEFEENTNGIILMNGDRVWIPSGGHPDVTNILSNHNIEHWLEASLEDRMYRRGLLMLIGGFLLQFIGYFC